MEKSNPIYERVEGSPYQPKDFVRVVLSEEPDEGIDDCIGKKGVVVYLEYECGCGQSFPFDPMIGVQLEDGRTQEFWHEELEEG